MNETTETTTTVEAPAAQVQKWTADAANPPGPIQVNKFNKVHRHFGSEHNAVIEKWGVIGGEEHSSCMVAIFGAGNRPDVTAAQVEIGTRFAWTVSRANIGEVTSAMEAALKVLAANRPVKDTRRTPEQEAARQAECKAHEDAQETERARKAAALPPPPSGNFQSGTIRRDVVRRLVEDGKLVLIDSYHFDDSTGAERGVDKPLPVAIAPADWHDRKEGIAYVHASDFEGNCGHAAQGSSGDITLYVHSNCNYTFRRVAVPEGEQAESAGGALGTVRRNREHDGVEISFPSKPSSGVLDALKREGFRWSRFSKVWYKKHTAASWKAACDIVGITAAIETPSDDGAAGYVQAQEEAYQDRAAEVCGA